MFAKDINNEILSSQVFYLHGNDFYWLEYANNFFIDLVPKKYHDVNIKIHDKLESLAEVIFTLSSFSFNDDTQLIFIKDSTYKAKKDELKVLLQLLQEGISPYILIFENVSFLSPQNRKGMAEINCSKLKNIDLAPIVTKKFNEYGGIDSRAVYMLLDYTNNDMAKINLEHQKLVAYADGKTVTTDMVKLLVNEDSDTQIYHFATSIAEGKKQQAIKYLEELTRKGQRKSYILASLINQYRRILHSAISPRSNKELSAIFGVKEYAILKARQITSTSQLALKRTLDMLVDYEYRFKSGIMSEASAFDAVVSNLLAQ